MTELTLAHVSKQYTLRSGKLAPVRVQAVQDVSLTIRSGETVALVGESGSGKSTIARMIMRLTEESQGTIALDGRVYRGGTRKLRPYRSQVQMVFQDPFSSLNPAKTIRHHLSRPLRLSGIVTNRVDEERAMIAALERVNLTPARQYLDKFPHELSGGQRQRIAIARALAPRPSILVADEPVSMLDVSIRMDILELLEELQAADNLGVLYITHDLATARHFSTSVIVLNSGRIVERGTNDEVILDPQHPYSQLLVRAAPDSAGDSFTADLERHRASADLGVVCSVPGCELVAQHFDARSLADDGTGRWVRCWLHEPSMSRVIADLAVV